MKRSACRPISTPSTRRRARAAPGARRHARRGLHRLSRHASHPGAAGAPPARSPRRNIPATCGRCHADAALMAAYKLPADQLAKFRGSVHGDALFVDEHPSAPTCATCHGAHGARAASGTSRPSAVTATPAPASTSTRARTARRAGRARCPSASAATATTTRRAPDLTLFDTACPTCHAAGSAGVRHGADNSRRC